MDGQRARRIVLGAWAGYVGLITIRQLLNPQERGLPPPRMFLASGVLFSIFVLTAPFARGLPATLAVGVDIAVLVNPYLKNSTDASVIQQLAGFIDTISGSQPSATPGSSGRAPVPQ